MQQVLAAYSFGSGAIAEPLAGGLINQTYLVCAAEPSGAVVPVAVLQRLHPVFGARVNEDIDSLTQHLVSLGAVTPTLIRTTDGRRWVDHDGGCWRALSYVAGQTIEQVADPRQAESAGALVGQFHRNVAGYEREFVHVRGNVHDTAAHMTRLRAHCDTAADAGEFSADARGLGASILASYAGAPELFTQIKRTIHGDLKISNVLFEPEDVMTARCLIDLDTIGKQPLAYEMGDALRSWGNPAGESTETPAINVDIVRAAIRGYASTAAGLFEAQEYAAIIPGLEVVCIELAARFCADVFDDSYFGWDESRFSSRREHNLVRARGQLALANSVAKVREELQSICNEELMKR